MRSLNHQSIVRDDIKRSKSPARETYHYATCQRLNKKGWNDLVKRYGLVGDEVRDGRTLIAYRRVREMTEAETVRANGRY